ncbi:MAG: hypothetical protein ACK58T_18060, partial [Phycisphaerae bacterium]
VHRIIPACAGNARPAGAGTGATTDHPLRRGERRTGPRRVLQKCGMTDECIRRARYLKNGVHVDEHVLSVVFD